MDAKEEIIISGFNGLNSGLLNWLNEPASFSVSADGCVLSVTPGAKSDFWQRTYYTPLLINDNGHICGTKIKPVQDSSVMAQVTFELETKGEQFDQGGLMLRVSETCWVKTGIEFVDGAPRISTVVTNKGYSDWSTQPFPDYDKSGVAKLTLRLHQIGTSAVVEVQSSSSDAFHFTRICNLDELNTSETEYLLGVMSCCPGGVNSASIKFSNFVIKRGNRAFHHSN
jgi:regulation of enolase protein 1 (concanavalin A-like superfamily)